MSEKLLEKVSPYNILNNIVPGAIFVYLCRLLNVDFFSVDSIFESFFVYYFWGMVSSRVGSLVIEQILMGLRIVKYSQKADYAMATKEDSLIEALLEVSNMYRTCAGVCLIIVIVKAYTTFLGELIPASISRWITIMVLLILFVASYCKQTQHITKRVEIAAVKKKEVTTDENT